MTDKLPDIMSEEEWRSFIETFNLKAPTGLRNAAMFTLMHDAGLRTCEVVGLRASDIHTDELDGAEVTCLHLHHTKGDRERVVYLTEEADELLRRWLDVKRDKGLARYRTVFTTLKGTPVASSYLREVAARKGAEAGIEWRVHPHALRHTFATDLLEDTGDLALVQDALGHADPSTTRIYAKVRNGRLATAMTRRRQRQEADPVDDIDEDTLRLARALQAAPDEVREALSAVLGEGQ